MPIENAPLPVDPTSKLFIEASGGLMLDKRGNEVLAGLSRVETEWYLANQPRRIAIRPEAPVSEDEQHWRMLHARYHRKRMDLFPKRRRAL